MMRFQLWGPKAAAIVRIYIQGSDSYIWRRRHGPIEFVSDGWLQRCDVQAFLAGFGLDLDSCRTRREMAAALDDKGLLTGDITSYRTFFEGPPDNSSPGAPSFKSNVIRLDDFVPRRGH